MKADLKLFTTTIHWCFVAQLSGENIENTYAVFYGLGFHAGSAHNAILVAHENFVVDTVEILDVHIFQPWLEIRADDDGHLYGYGFAVFQLS
jgi:hypothetical protein